MLIRDPIVRRRLLRHLWFLALLWPIITIAGATLEVTRLPYYTVSWPRALAASAFGTALLLPDLLLVGILFAGLSTIVFDRMVRPTTDRVHYAEPLVLFFTVIAGTALWYPGILGHSLLALPDWPAWTTPAVFLVLAVLCAFAVSRQRGARLALVAIVIGVVAPLPGAMRARLAGVSGHAPAILILGLDSVSAADDVSPLAAWVETNGGAWYQKAVTPGLFTNAVWSSILTQSPVSRHRVFHTFENLDANAATLLQAARSRGFADVSYFFDQTTCMVGSKAGFNEDESGPMGWRQLLIPIVANHTVLVPLVRSLLPDGWSALRANQPGTFSYSLDRSLREAMSAGRGGQPTLVMAHTTYLHSQGYPSSLDLGIDELKRVWSAQPALLRDRTLDWEDSDRSSDPIPMRAWKLRRLQHAVTNAVHSSGLLQNGGKLLLFSDHGNRIGLTFDNFGEDRFQHVILATFGVPARPVDEPISLIDVGVLAGVAATAPAQPVVEFSATTPATWGELVKTASLNWDGTVDLDARILDAAFANLKRHAPWARPLDSPAASPNPDRASKRYNP
jgi:hypothetical protein